MKWFLIILLLVIPVAIREIWLRYLAVMALKRARNEGKLSRAAFAIGLTLFIPAYVLDILGNLIICTVLFLDWPRETLITGRIQRYVDGPDGWRRRMAVWFAVHLLNPFDDGHIDGVEARND